MIDPEELRGTTLAFEKVEKPGRTYVARVEEPFSEGVGGKVSIIRELSSRDGYVVRWDAVLMGGEDKGLRLVGIAEELRLRNLSGRLVQRPVASITDTDRSYWGA